MAILSIGELLNMGGSVDPSALSAYVPFSGLDYSGTTITGISGSAIGGGGGGGGIDPATCSAIASSYAESAASSKVDQSAFDDCCSSVNSALSGISAAVSAVTGQTGNYLPASASSDFAPASALTGKLDNSASSTWYPFTGNPSGFLTTHQSLSGYATQAYVDSSVSSRAYTSSLTAYQPKSSISSWTSQMSSISAKQDKSAMTAYAPNSAISSWSSKFVYKSAVSAWSSQIATLSSAVSSLSATLSAITANKYTLSAGAGISLTNNTSTKTTIIATV